MCIFGIISPLIYSKCAFFDKFNVNNQYNSNKTTFNKDKNSYEQQRTTNKRHTKFTKYS